MNTDKLIPNEVNLEKIVFDLCQRIVDLEARVSLMERTYTINTEAIS